MGQPRPLFLFSVFSNKHHYNFYNRSIWKNVCPSSICRLDPNPQPSVREPPPITTKPGLPLNPSPTLALHLGFSEPNLVHLSTFFLFFDFASFFNFLSLATLFSFVQLDGIKDSFKSKVLTENINCSFSIFRSNPKLASPFRYMSRAFSCGSRMTAALHFYSTL